MNRRKLISNSLMISFKNWHSSVFFTLLCIGLAQVSCVKNGSSNTVSDPKSLPSSSESIVYVNSDSLLEKYDYYKKIKSGLEEKTKSMQIDAEQKQNRFMQEVQAYEKNSFNLTPAEKKTTEERLGKEKQQIQAFQQSLSQQLQQESQEQNDKLYSKIKAFLDAYAKSNHYKLILGYSNKGGALLYAEPGMEITNSVIKGLNESYAHEK